MLINTIFLAMHLIGSINYITSSSTNQNIVLIRLQLYYHSYLYHSQLHHYRQNNHLYHHTEINAIYTGRWVLCTENYSCYMVVAADSQGLFHKSTKQKQIKQNKKSHHICRKMMALKRAHESTRRNIEHTCQICVQFNRLNYYNWGNFTLH